MTHSPVMIASCACGSVEVKALGKPIVSAACYCDDCQKGAAQLEALQQTAPAHRGGQRQIELADGAAMQRHPRADGVVQAQRPVLRLDAIEIDHLAVEQRADVAGLVDRMHQALQHHMRCVVAHR